MREKQIYTKMREREREGGRAREREEEGERESERIKKNERKSLLAKANIHLNPPRLKCMEEKFTVPQSSGVGELGKQGER